MPRRSSLVAPVLLLASGCAFQASGTSDAPADADPTAPDAPTADADPRAPDAFPSVEVTLRIDSKAEFEALGAGISTTSLTDATIGDGFVAPRAWAIGALDTRGANSRIFDDATPLVELWTLLTTAEATPNVVTGRALADLTTRTYDTGAPGGLGLTVVNDWTIWADGEIFLEAGEHAFAITGDGTGYLAIAPAGDADASGTVDDDEYVDVLSNDVAAPLAVTVPTAGWWPMRYALSDGNGVALSRVTLDPPGDAPVTQLSRWRLRARADQRAGLVRSGFAAKDLLLGVDESLLASAAIDEDYGADAPIDLTGYADNWSQRLAGQLWIATAGAYTFTVNADDGYRLFVDDATIAAWTSGVHVATLAVTLTRGWHDLRIEHQENGGDADIKLEITVAPDAADLGLVPLARLRPVVTGRDRVATVTTRTGVVGNGTYTLDLDAPVGAEPLAIAIAFDATTDFWSDLKVSIQPPWSASATTFYENAIDFGRKVRTYPTGLDDLPPIGGNDLRGAWTIRIADAIPASPTTLNAWGVTARFKGGPPAIAPTSSWWSSVREIHDGDRVVATDLDLTSVLPPGTTAIGLVRLCDDPACDGEGDSWFDPVTTLPAAQAPGAYAQLRVDLGSTDGVGSPLVDAVDASFTTVP